LQLDCPNGRMRSMTNLTLAAPAALAIRPATLDDLNLCLMLDASYFTDLVWQMDVQSEERGRTMTFRRVRLPRQMRVAYPRDRQQLAANWKRCDGFLVALWEERLCGYAALTAHAAEEAAWLHDWVVSPERRRQGVGTALLAAAVEWAKSQSLRRVLIQVQTKNHPAISLCEKQGFSLCGFNDRFYANQDIAVFFARSC